MNALTKQSKRTWLEIGFVVLVLSVITSLWVSKKDAQVVVFDKGVAIAKLAKTLNAHRIDSTKQARIIQQFKQAMTEVLADEAYAHHLVIVSSSSVLAGAEDCTAQLLPKIAQRMKARQARAGGLNVKA